jgi:hypothetical protein
VRRPLFFRCFSTRLTFLLTEVVLPPRPASPVQIALVWGNPRLSTSSINDFDGAAFPLFFPFRLNHTRPLTKALHFRFHWPLISFPLRPRPCERASIARNDPFTNPSSCFSSFRSFPHVVHQLDLLASSHPTLKPLKQHPIAFTVPFSASSPVHVHSNNILITQSFSPASTSVPSSAQQAIFTTIKMRGDTTEGTT